jgi:uncharacterized protein (TIGR03118 family)
MRAHPSRAAAPRLAVEPLEDRSVPAGVGFHETDFVSDQPGDAAATDANLVNGWGIALSPTGSVYAGDASGSFWVADDGTDKASLYSGDVGGGALTVNPLVVNIPGGAPTGEVFNGTSDFTITNGTTSAPAVFIFAAESGKISGWNPTVSMTDAQVAVTSPTAVYKGVTIGTNATGNFLFAADFHDQRIDVFDKTFAAAKLAGTFTDPNLPAGFAPFNVQDLGGKLFVAYAKRPATGDDEDHGAGLGVVDEFDTDGNFVRRVATQGRLNAPWGLAIAPGGFGPFGGDLLVGNFGDGRINAFDPATGADKGFLTDPSGNPVVIDGLWGMTFGNGKTAGDTSALYFAAGPGDESHGLFGKLTVAPAAPGRGGDGPGHDLVAVSGQASGAAQLFALGADGKLTAQGSPLAPFTGFTGPVRSTTADVNGDGVADTILVTGPGGPTRLAVISGADNKTQLLSPTDPFGDSNFTGGAFVTAGDMDLDGRAEIVVTPDEGGGPRVVVFDLVEDAIGVRANFFGIDDPAFRGGARSAVGDLNADGTLDLVVAAGFGGGPRVAVFEGVSVLAGSTPVKLVNDFFAFPGSDATTLRNGVFVTAGDFDGDGTADLAFGGGPGGGPRVLVISGAPVRTGLIDQAVMTPIANFFAFDGSQRGGVRVATKEGDADGRRDLVVGSGDGQAPAAAVFRGATLQGGNPPGVTTTPFTDATEVNGVFVG